MKKIREVVDNAQNGYLSPDEIHALLDAAGVARAKEGVSDNEEEIVKMAKRDWVPAGNESCRADPQVGCRWSCVERERRGDGSA